MRDESSKTFLRPETAQGIFVNFKNVLDSTRVKIPFGIAQIGKSFRNEITPRNFTFRSREFEQMEIEFFCHPATSPQWYKYWRDRRYQLVSRSGPGRRPAAAARSREGGTEPLFLRHGRHRICFSLPPGRANSANWKAWPIAAISTCAATWKANSCARATQLVVELDAEGKPKYRGSGKDLTYFDDQTRERFIPHVIEPSAGADRATLAFLCEAYNEDEAPGRKRRSRRSGCF